MAVDTPASTTDQPPAPASRLSPRVVIGAAVGLGVLLLAVILVVQLFVVRRIPLLTDAALDAAQQRWSQRGPADYVVDLVLAGATPGTIHIEVRGGQAAAFTRDGRTPRERRTWDVWTVPGQFDMIARELELAEDPVHEMQAQTGTRLELHCEFDPQYGFPRQFHRITYGGGPEVYWRVTNFAPN